MAKTNDSILDGLNNDGTSADDQQENIWSSILKGVASSKIVPTKSLLILGDRESGKSTLIRHLKGEEDEDVYEANGSVSKSVGTDTDDLVNQKLSHNDLALSYTFVEVKDDDAEDTLARLGLYQLAGSQEAYQSLLRFALNSSTLPDSLVVIVLDWARPWTFVETLQRWAKFLEKGIENIKTEGAVGAKDGWTKGKAVVDEMKEAHTNTTNGTGASSAEAETVALPLGPGTLVTNLAVPLVVVCTKSDNVFTLEREKDYKEEQFDFIQQSLRTICLKYGAALFYTTTRQPKTFINLRKYILHRLLGTMASHSDTKSYVFNIEPTFVDRDTVLVPAGWDSWGKIGVLREGFDCNGLLKGWDLDVTGKAEQLEGDNDHVDEILSARKVFEDVVKHVENEKEFFARHVETLKQANSERPPSVVGPMGAPQYTYVNLGEEIPDLDVAPVPNLQNLPAKPIRSKSTPATSSPPPGQLTNGNTPTVPNGTNGTSSQNEVLANFFQALLTKKATQTSTNTGSSQETPPNDVQGGMINNKSPNPSRKTVKKELDKLRGIPSNTAVSTAANSPLRTDGHEEVEDDEENIEEKEKEGFKDEYLEKDFLLRLENEIEDFGNGMQYQRKKDIKVSADSK
ncbi:3151_t:CDS:10 [Diversispora eburnea]|uniref:3151_t:CDS:1 n=1 Tax=Diversispora eburnea TaxID=1213867 RepID=A0A9N9BNL6_9GLOM|nr:3151_t:CDS:10 [Diversispora eburnea]